MNIKKELIENVMKGMEENPQAYAEQLRVTLPFSDRRTDWLRQSVKCTAIATKVWQAIEQN